MAPHSCLSAHRTGLLAKARLPPLGRGSGGGMQDYANAADRLGGYGAGKTGGGAAMYRVTSYEAPEVRVRG